MKCIKNYNLLKLNKYQVHVDYQQIKTDQK
jgi:hypothetical protein